MFFLFCFVASVSANAIQSLNLPAFKTNPVKKEAIAFSEKNLNADSEIDLLSEENENETQDSFSIPAFALSLFKYNYRFHTTGQKTVSAQPFADKYSNPIYIAICNFRI